MLSDVDSYEVVGEAKNGEEAVQLARNLKPQVVLMDVKMPGIGGLEATKKLLALNPEIKIIIVTACNDDLYPERLMKAGAMGYITKGARLDEMITAINTVIDAKPYMSNDVAQQLALKKFGHKDNSDKPFETLSERELQTAVMIANGHKVQAIADTFCVSPKTVNSYRYRIFEKLKVNSDVELALLAVRHNVLQLDSVS
ncbi:UvrY/SirA/GacA family response regulator transcription factor [Aurantivibrio infirmus]